MRGRKGGAGWVDSVGGVLRVLVLSVFGTFSGSSLYCGTGAAVIVVVLFFPPVLLFTFWPVYIPWSRLLSFSYYTLNTMYLDVYFITGVESNQGYGDLLHGFIWIKHYYFSTGLCHHCPNGSFWRNKNGKLKIMIHCFDYVVQKATDGWKFILLILMTWANKEELFLFTWTFALCT